CGIGDQERPKLITEEARGMESFQLLGFTDIKALADVDECGDYRILGSEFLGNPGSDVRGGEALRRFIACMPVVLMSRVKDMAEVCGNVRADDGAQVHHTSDRLKSL